MHRAPLSPLVLTAGLIAACDNPPAPPVTAVPDRPPAVASQQIDGLPPIAAAASPLERTPDGIPIMPVRPRADEREGEVRWLRPIAKTLQWTSNEASDGAHVYFATSDDGADVVVRDGVVREGVLRGLGVARGGCGAARGGELLLSGVVNSDDQEVIVVDGKSGQRTTRREPRPVQMVARVAPTGAVTRVKLPDDIATEPQCRAWLAADGTYALGLFGMVTWDGNAFHHDMTKYAGRLVLGSPTSPRYCFSSCNAAEETSNPPRARELLAKIDCPGADWHAHDGWVAGACPSGKAVRVGPSGVIEVVSGLPPSRMLNGHYDMAFTAAGDLVLGLAYRFARYVVWPAGQSSPSAERTLAAGDVLAKASPTMIVRGLGGTVPASTTSAVVLGADNGYGTGGGTYGYDGIRRSKEAHEAQVARARAVLGAGELVVAHEAVVELGCGAYVRSPIGHEAMNINDWTPPVLPALSAKAVTKPEKCLPLASVSALPGNPDLLLAIAKDGDLWGAWLPPPLPLPQGSSFGKKLDKGPIVQDPRPGTGWIRVGPAERVEGEDATPAPGADTKIADHTWQAGGAAVVRVAGAEILVMPLGTVTLPPGAKPMAVGTGLSARAWAAIGDKLVDCAMQCRVLDPGVRATITGVVPRSVTELILGYGPGRAGVYVTPAASGDVIAAHPLERAFAALRAAMPRR